MAKSGNIRMCSVGINSTAKVEGSKGKGGGADWHWESGPPDHTKKQPPIRRE